MFAHRGYFEGAGRTRETVTMHDLVMGDFLGFLVPGQSFANSSPHTPTH